LSKRTKADAVQKIRRCKQEKSSCHKNGREILRRQLEGIKNFTNIDHSELVSSRFNQPPNKYCTADLRRKPGFGGIMPRMPKLLTSVREVLRMKHYSLRTEQAYVDWIKRFIFFHNKRHPGEMSEPEIRAFISDLASNRNVW
jgi:Phage integrase, N-terminal SAM-like domain